MSLKPTCDAITQTDIIYQRTQPPFAFYRRSYINIYLFKKCLRIVIYFKFGWLGFTAPTGVRTAEDRHFGGHHTSHRSVPSADDIRSPQPPLR